MSLSSIIAEAVEANESGGIINRQGAIGAALPRVLADQELTEACVRGHLSKAIATNVKRRNIERDTVDTRQGFFGLREVHVVDNGDGDIKTTRALSQLEFQSLISVRERQVEADRAYLDRLRAAASVTKFIWDRHPDWTWGQVEDAYAQLKRAA